MLSRACSEGQQLLEDYGDNMDKIYIQYHGFVPDSNPFRCVYLNPVPLGSIPRVQQRGNKVDEIGGVRELLDLMEFRQTPSQCVDSKGMYDTYEAKTTIYFLSFFSGHCMSNFYNFLFCFVFLDIQFICVNL